MLPARFALLSASCPLYHCLLCFMSPLPCRKAPPGAMYSIGHKFQLNGVMVATSEPALWGYPQQAGDLMQAVG